MSFEGVFYTVALGALATFSVWFIIKLTRPPKAFVIGLGALGLFVAAIAISFVVSGGMASRDVRAEPQPPMASTPRVVTRTWRDDMTINGSWTKGGFGSIALWDVTVKNLSKTTTYKDVRFATRYAGESGTVVRESQGVLLIVVKPGQTRTVREVNDGFISGQVSGAEIRVTGAEPVR